MINNFNANIAIESSVDVAIFVQQLSQWTFLNLANKQNIHDGHCWSYNKLEAYKIFFPYWTSRQLQRVINTAVKEGYVIKGNYNKHKYDRTCWYALTPKGLCFFPELKTKIHLQTLYSSISPNGEMYFTEWCEAVHQTVITIPTSNTTSSNISIDILEEDGAHMENNDYSNHKNKKPDGHLEMMKENNPHELDEDVMKDWIKVRKTKRAAITKTAWMKYLEILSECKEAGLNPKDCFATAVANGWISIKADWFLNKKLDDKGFQWDVESVMRA